MLLQSSKGLGKTGLVAPGLTRVDPHEKTRMKLTKSENTYILKMEDTRVETRRPEIGQICCYRHRKGKEIRRLVAPRLTRVDPREKKRMESTRS